MNEALSDSRAKVELHTDPSGLSTAVITPTGRVRRQILCTMGFRAWLDPFEIQRFVVLAGVLSARVVVPETPGCGRLSSRLYRSEAAGLIRGRFHPVAERMVSTARPFLDHEVSVPLHLMGYSLGASVSAAALDFIEVDDELPIRAITLIEPVALRRWPAAKLIWATHQEDRRSRTYVNRNATWRGAVPPSAAIPDGPSPQTHLMSMLLEGNALRRGDLTRDLFDGLGNGDAAVLVVHGSDSLLSLPLDCDRLVLRLRAEGRSVFDLPVAGGHPLWHSLDDVAALAVDLNAHYERVE